MQIGQDGDTRPYRRLKKSDYYVAKDAYEAPRSFSRCDVCGESLTGYKLRVEEGKHVCFRCSNE